MGRRDPNKKRDPPPKPNIDGTAPSTRMTTSAGRTVPKPKPMRQLTLPSSPEKRDFMVSVMARMHMNNTPVTLQEIEDKEAKVLDLVANLTNPPFPYSGARMRDTFTKAHTTLHKLWQETAQYLVHSTVPRTSNLPEPVWLHIHQSREAIAARLNKTVLHCVHGLNCVAEREGFWQRLDASEFVLRIP